MSYYFIPSLTILFLCISNTTCYMQVTKTNLDVVDLKLTGLNLCVNECRWSLQPLFRSETWAQAGVDPTLMGIGQVDTTSSLCY